LNLGQASLRAIRNEFDQHVVGAHIQGHHNLDMPVNILIDELNKLSEQSYENKTLTFGCVLDPNRHDKLVKNARFPDRFLESKKYKALSDGFHTAYEVSRFGRLVDFVDLEFPRRSRLTKKHYYPQWAEHIAQASRQGRCGFVLSRQGEILVFDEGALRFTYRIGRWQYWNHSHLVNLLKDRARAQKVKPKLLGRVVGSIYRAALDVSFRRSGGLFVLLHNRKNISEIVRRGDAIGDLGRSIVDSQFDSAFSGKSIQNLPRSVIVDLSSLDGAIVLDNTGKILAYGAVLQPRNTGRLRGTEGSRTKAAIGASNYGLAVKISSDGGITVYHEAKEFIRI
jgi:hypothetical protein